MILSSSAYAYNISIDYFYGAECPHCAKATPFLTELEDKYPELTVRAYETWHNKANAKLFTERVKEAGLQIQSVPTFFIDSKAIVGFDSAEGRGIEIEEIVVKYIKEGSFDLQNISGNVTSCSSSKSSIVNLPIVGSIDTKNISLPIFTIIIGLLDGFNPCSMWVLLFLLTLLVMAGSRKKMLFVAGLFIFVSGAGYFLFMTAWLNFFLYIGFFSWMRILVAIAAIIAGLINMKEMFWFKKGPSLSIADKHKATIIRKMHNIIHEASIPAIIIGIASLAMTINFVEFLCTAGFPAIFTGVLAMNNLSYIQHYGYILLYILMYELDDLIILGIALIFFSKKTLSKTQGKWMKFIAGLMMFLLGLILIIKPELLMFG